MTHPLHDEEAIAMIEMNNAQFLGRVSDLLKYIADYQQESKLGEDVFSGITMTEYANEATRRSLLQV